MLAIIKQKQLRLPISIVQTITYMQGSCMITIGKIPRKLQSFFKPVKKQVSEHVNNYFWSFMLSICISNGCTIERLVKSLRNTTHRTNHGEFLWRSNWNESIIMQQIALDMLLSLFTKKTIICFSLLMTPRLSNEPKKWKASASFTIMPPASMEQAIPF